MADLNVSVTEEEQVLSSEMQKYWANFFHTGDVSNGPFQVQVPWPRYATSTDQDLRITTPSFHVETGLKHEGTRLSSWLSFCENNKNTQLASFGTQSAMIMASPC